MHTYGIFTNMRLQAKLRTPNVRFYLPKEGQSAHFPRDKPCIPLKFESAIVVCACSGCQAECADLQH